MAATWALYAKSITRFFYYPTPFPLTGCLPDCHDCYALIPLIHVPIVVFDTGKLWAVSRPVALLMASV